MATVSSQRSVVNGTCVWAPRFRYHITEELSEEVVSLLGVLEKFTTLEGNPAWKRALCKDGVYFVKSSYRNLIFRGCKCPIASVLWKVKVPLKVKL